MWLDQKQSTKKSATAARILHLFVEVLSMIFVLSVLFVSHQEKAACRVFYPLSFVYEPSKEGRIQRTLFSFVCEPSREGRMLFALSCLFCLWAIERRQNAVYFVLSVLFVSHQEKAEYSGHTHTHAQLQLWQVTGSWVCLYFQDLNYTTGSQGWMRVCLFVNKQKIATVTRTCVETGRSR